MRDFHREIFFLDFFGFTNHFPYGIYAKIFFIFVFGGVKTTTPSKPGANAALTANPGSKRLIVFTHRFFYSDFLHGLDWRRWPGWPSNPVHDRTIICIDPESLHKISVHSGERFTCDKCPSTFSAVGSLWTHNKVKHENRRFSCSFFFYVPTMQ